MNGSRPDGKVDVFVEWPGRLDPGDRRSVAEIEADGCFHLHRIDWLDSVAAEAGGYKLCRYRAPDAESVRHAFRQGGVPVDAVWSGTLREIGEAAKASVVVERKFAAPLQAADAVAIVRAEHLLPRGYELLRVIQPCARDRIICVCAAATVTAPPREAEGDAAIWRCRLLRRTPAVATARIRTLAAPGRHP